MRVKFVRAFRVTTAWLTVAFLAASAGAALKLPAMFGDNMVLQQGMAWTVWGWADAGKNVTVTFAGRSVTTTAGKDGRWTAKLAELKPGGPAEMTIAVAGGDRKTIKNVLVGEVWVCSGQSNMAMSVRGAANAQQEIAAANFPQIRMFTVRRAAAAKPQADCTGAWQVCSPKTVHGFSATAYYFGRPLHKALKVPVGLINTSWGGTRIEAWTSQAALMRLEYGRKMVEEIKKAEAAYDPEAAKERYEQALARWKQRMAKWQEAKKAGKAKGRAPRRPRPPSRPRMGGNSPGALYNGMIAPLIPLAIRGAIWYQGERNTRGRTSAYEYRNLLPNMIANWRADWKQGDFPFLFVQLPNFQGRGDDSWPIIRESMLLTLKTPKTGMAVTIDIGDNRNIHPKNKQDVGARLALAARHVAYGEKLRYSGPIYESMKVEAGKVRLTFKHADGGLTAKGGGALTGFAIAGKDRKFVPAEARIDPSTGSGQARDTVVVWSDKVPQPASVRYAWDNDPQCNLANKVAGLPASPFRTDDWPLLTQDKP